MASKSCPNKDCYAVMQTDTDNFCYSCGSELKVITDTCVKCKAHITKADRFCTNCGRPTN